MSCVCEVSLHHRHNSIYSFSLSFAHLLSCVCVGRLGFMIRNHCRRLIVTTQTFILHLRPQSTMQGALHVHRA
jgi:hypothetical protein